ncbi:MAG: hemolysin III family protein [Candidimonas sp.]|nr:MAG: hemolysin III family protein [Candidimonas sp.]
MVYGERFNSISHLVGAALAAVATVFLIVLAAREGNPWKIVSFSVYGAMLLTMYTTSTLYHSLRGRAKRIWCKFDHCTIYLLIAGSYTPFLLVSLRGAWGWTLFGAVWALAVVGIAQEILLAKGARVSSLVIYLAMGWLGLVAIGPLADALTWPGVAWLVAGGLFYTAGLGFYVNDRRLWWGHGVWHLFVLMGSACHFIAIVLYVALSTTLAR